MENFGGNKTKQESFLFICWGRLKKTQETLIKTRKDWVILVKKVNKAPNIYLTGQTLSTYGLWKSVKCSEKMKKLKVVRSSDKNSFISIYIFPYISTSLVKNLTVKLDLQSWLSSG